MKKLSVNDLHKSLKGNLGTEFKMDELDFAKEFTQNKEYRDLVLNQIIPAIDSEFTPDLAREIEEDLKKKDSSIGSTLGYGESGVTTSLEPVDPPKKKKLAQYYSWENRPFLGAKTPQQFVKRRKMLKDGLPKELDIFEQNFLNRDNSKDDFFSVIDIWQQAYGKEGLGQFWDDDQSRDDMVARGVMNQRAIQKSLSFVDIWQRTNYPDGFPDEVLKGNLISEEINKRSAQIALHQEITQYLDNPTDKKLQELLRATNTQDVEGLSKWYNSNAEDLLELDDIAQIEVKQPIPEVQVGPAAEQQDLTRVPNVGFTGSIADGLAYLEELRNTDSYKDYEKVVRTREYLINQLDAQAEFYPEYTAKIAAQMKVQEKTDRFIREMEQSDDMFISPVVKTLRPIVRSGLSVLHGIFDIERLLLGLVSDKAKMSRSINAFVDFFDPDNNAFTNQSSRQKRQAFEYMIDLGNGYQAVYNKDVKEGGTIQYVIDTEGFMVNNPFLAGKLIEKANKLVEDGVSTKYDFNTQAFSAHAFQGLIDVGAMMLGGEAMAASRAISKGTQAGMKFKNFLRTGVGAERLAITGDRIKMANRHFGSTSTMFFQFNHSIYDQAIMAGMTQEEASYYSLGSSLAISIVNRLNPEYLVAHNVGKTIKNFQVQAIERGLTNRDMFRMGMEAFFKTVPKASLMEGIEERYLERGAQNLVGEAMQMFTPKDLQTDVLRQEVLSLDEMEEFYIGALIGFGNPTVSVAKTYSDVSLVHSELMYLAYNNKEKAFEGLNKFVGKNTIDAEGEPIVYTEEMAKNTIDQLNKAFTELDAVVEEGRRKGIEYTDFHKQQMLQLLVMKPTDEQVAADGSLSALVSSTDLQVQALANDPSLIDAAHTTPYSDAFVKVQANQKQKKLKEDVDALMGNKNTNTDPKHLQSLSAMLESNFKNVPVYVDKDAFRSFMKRIGVPENKLDSYRGVYDEASNSILINPQSATLGTPIHEYSHIWLNYVKKNNPELYAKMESLVKASPELMGLVENNPVYQGVEAMEAMVIAIEKRAEEVIQDPNLLEQIKTAIKELFDYLAKVFNVKTDDFMNMSLQEFVDTGAYEVLTGDFKVGGTIDALPAQSTSLNSNIGNTMSVLTNSGRIEGSLAKNKDGGFVVRTEMGDVQVASPQDGSMSIGDKGLLRTDLNDRVKIIPAQDEAGSTERLVDIDGRLHLVTDDSMAKDNKGRSYGLILKDKETGQEVFFSVDNEITQEIMRKAVAGRYFSMSTNDAGSELFQIGIAPFRNRPVNTQKDFESAMETPQYKFFENTLDDISSELNIKSIDSFAALGGYQFENGEYVNEVSRVMQLQGPREDIELLSAVMGILAPEQQESVMMLEIGDSLVNAEIEFDPQLGFHVIPETVWSDTFDSRRLFMLEMVRKDFESATGITGQTINEEAEAFDEKYGYRPYFFDVSEEGEFVMSFPYSVKRMIDLMSKSGITLGGYPFVSKTRVDFAFKNGFTNIDNEAIELLSTINAAFSRIYNTGLPGRFELNFGTEYSQVSSMSSDEMTQDLRDRRQDIIDDAELDLLKIKQVLGYIAKRTVGTDEEVYDVFKVTFKNMYMPENKTMSYSNASIPFSLNTGIQRNFDKPLGLIIEMESSELEGVDKVRTITNFAKSVGIKGYSFDPNTNRLHIFVNDNNQAYRVISALEEREDVKQINYARVKPRFKSESSTRTSDSNRSRVERGYYETIKAYRSKRPDLANERPNLHNALSVAEEAYVRDEAYRSDNRSMINAPVKIEWNDAKRDYMIGGMTMEQYGFRYGVTNFGGVRPTKPVHVGGGIYWDIPGGLDLSSTFTYAELIWMKEQGWNPNDIKDEFVRTTLYRQLARTHTQEDIERDVIVPEGMTLEEYMRENSGVENEVVSLDEADTFNRYIFGMLSPNQPLTPNEMQVAAMRVQGVQDKQSDEAISKWFNGGMVGPANSHALPGDLYAEGFTYNPSSVSMNTLNGPKDLIINYTIKHHVSDGSIHTQKHKERVPFDGIRYMFVDNEGNPPIDADILQKYVEGDLGASNIFPDNYNYRLVEREAEFRWPEVMEGFRLYILTSQATRTEAEDEAYAEFLEYVEQVPWLNVMLITANRERLSINKKTFLLEREAETLKDKFVRGYVADNYLSNFNISFESESLKHFGSQIEGSVQDAGKREQGRLNNKKVDAIFREDAGIVRSNLYMGVANIDKGDKGTLSDGTKIAPETRVFFHGTRFFFDKLDRVEEAKGAATATWNKTMKPVKGFTPFISPSWSLANGFKGIGGEVLAITVAADTKVFDPARMGNPFGELTRDETLPSNAADAFSEQLHRDIESLARGEETVLPFELIGSALIVGYMANQAYEGFFETYFPKDVQNFKEGDERFLELSYEYGVKKEKVTLEFFEDISSDREFIRRLALDLLAEDFSVDDVETIIKRDIVRGQTPNFIGRLEYDDVIVKVDDMDMNIYSVPNYLFASLLYDYALEGLDTEFADLVERYQDRRLSWTEGTTYTNYISWTANQYEYAKNVPPIIETVAMLMQFADNNFKLTEQPSVVDFFEEKGFDAFIVRESSGGTANLAVINPDKINLKYRRGAPGIPSLRNSFTAQDVEKVTIQGLANMYPKDPSEPLTKEERKELNDKMKLFFNMQKMDEGGLGLAGSADLSNVARFAAMYIQNPKFFMKKKVETWIDFLERVQNQVPGLSSKTGAFALVWQDPNEAAISAMDRHMFRIFEKELFSNKETKAEFERMVVQRWNAQVEKAASIKGAKKRADYYKAKSTLIRKGAVKANNLDDVMTQYEYGQVGAIYMETGFSMLSNNPVKFRYKSGEVNPTISANLRGTNFIVEPDKVQSISDNYMRMLAINEEQARKSGLSVFMSQWALWDKARNRFEPHEIMFPGLHKLPRLSFTNLNKARQGHRDVGYFNSSKIEKFNEELKEMTKEMKPVSKAEPGSLMYFSMDPYQGIDMKQAKEMINFHRGEGMSPDAIRQALIQGGMNTMVADSLISNEFNPSDPTISEKLRKGYMNFASRLSPETRENITENAKKYLPRSNKITTADALLMLENMGLESAYDLLMNPAAMRDERLRIGEGKTIPGKKEGVLFADSEVRVVLTRIVAEEFDKIANQMVAQENPELEKEYRAYSHQLMDVLLPELTQKGRFIQAASILSRASGSYYVQHINNRLRAKGSEPMTEEESAEVRRLHAAMKNAADGLPKIEAEAALLRFVSETLPVTLYEILENQYYANLLSGYGTNLKNIYGSLQQMIFEGTTEAIAGKSAKDAGAYYFGMLKGILPAFDVFRYIISTGVQYGYNTNVPGLSAGKFDDTKLTEGLPLYEYMKGGLAQLTSKDGPGIFKGSNMISTAFGRLMLTIFNPSIMKYFGRFLIGTDVAFSTMGQSAQIELMKSRLKRGHKFATDNDLTEKARELVFGIDAERETRYKGYSDQAVSEGFKKGTKEHRIRVFELSRADEVTEKMGERAFRKGQEYTYNYEPEGYMGELYSLFIGALKSTRDKPMGVGVRIAKSAFIPFARILVNVANRGYSYSPLGFLKQSAGLTTKLVGKEARKIGKGGTWTNINDYEKSLARARATIGTLITMSLYALTKGGEDDDDDLPWFTITGAGPSDYSKRYQLETNRVYKPFTITFNRSLSPANYGEIIPRGERKRIDYRDSMVFMTLAAIGTIRDHERFGGESEEEANRAISTAVAYAASMLASMNESTLVKGLSDLFKEVQPSGFQSAAQQGVETKLNGVLKKFYRGVEEAGKGLLTPSLVRQLTRTGRGLSNRAMQQRVGSIENPDGYFKDLVRDMHMIDPDFPIMDHFGRPVVPSIDNYLPILVQPSKEESEVHNFFREIFLDENIFIPKHRFPVMIDETGKQVELTQEEEMMYFALRGALIYDGLEELMMQYEDGKTGEDFDEAAFIQQYPDASEETIEAERAEKPIQNAREELSDIVSNANELAEEYLRFVKFGDKYPTVFNPSLGKDVPFELPDYIVNEAPYYDELFKVR